MKPMTTLIEHTLQTLDGLPTARRIELLSALLELAVSKPERDAITAQIRALRQAEHANQQLLLNLRAARAA